MSSEVQVAGPSEEKTPWQRVQNARHPKRPHTLDYVQRVLTDFHEIHGDRFFGDDPAIVCGMGRLDGQPVMLIGEQKGRDTKQKLYRNFGMPKPEGYRKALRAMQMAAKFGRPIITFLDTPGAYPGIDAEERGQAEAIARSIEACLQLQVPMVSSIIGEGGSGGAIALAAGNKVLMLEHAVYSVITPEGCASILWRSAENAQDAAEALKLTAQDLLRLGVIDAVVPEPLGAAHRDPEPTIAALGDAIDAALRPLLGMDGPELRAHRREKFLAMGNRAL
jgi:acetyl-CoA carboxylase carboxyl transferase subunit alpha